MSFSDTLAKNANPSCLEILSDRDLHNRHIHYLRDCPPTAFVCHFCKICDHGGQRFVGLSKNDFSPQPSYYTEFNMRRLFFWNLLVE